jgi:hypothetical protein
VVQAWLRAALPGVAIEGSGYVGHDHRGGRVHGGIRHEDVTALSFADASVDLIVSNDVSEHVPDVDRAFEDEPRYHGNPVSAQGSLVFHDFGRVVHGRDRFRAMAD